MADTKNKINMSDVGFTLQSLTVNDTSNELWMMFSGEIYRIPMNNLDATTDRLYLCDLGNGFPLQKTSLDSVAPVLSVLPRTREILWIGIIAKSYYFVETIDTYYIFQHDGNLWCDSYDDKLMAWKLTAMKHPKETDKELWVGLKQVVREKKASRRVVFTPLRMTVISSRQNSEGANSPATCNLVEFNLPGEDMGDFMPVEHKGPFVFLETNADRSKATFVLSDQSVESSYHKDLFALPPIVLVKDSKMYMISLELGRVYVMDSQDLTTALETAKGQVQKSFPIRSMPWWVFFTCKPPNPRDVKNSSEPAAEDSYYPEPSQAKYLEEIGDLYPEEPFNWWWWLEDYAEELIIAALVVTITIALILCAYRRNMICTCLKNYAGKARNISRKFISMVSAHGKSFKEKHSRRSKKSSIDSEEEFQNEVKRMLKIDAGSGGTDSSKISKRVNKSQIFSSETSKPSSDNDRQKVINILKIF